MFDVESSSEEVSKLGCKGVGRVQYTHQLTYLLDSQGKPFPISQLRISKPLIP